jgi:dihydroorotase
MILNNAFVYRNGRMEQQNYELKVGGVGFLSDFNKLCIFPAFCDVHVHFREPGFSYKETIRTGSLAAARGGYTDVCTMPNLNPVPDSAENIKEQIKIIERDAAVRVHPYAAITVGEKGEMLTDMKALSPYCIAFSDDGKGVQSEDMMREAMIKAKALGKIIAAHCEDNSLLCGGYIHKGEYARLHGHKGICAESEWKPIERDLRLAKETGCKYHVCHISCKESVELIRKAKAEGVDVTCETAPHYLIFNDMDLKESGSFKMNPPIRSEEDRQALIQGLQDGTIDMIATDHAPHSSEEKSRGLQNSLMGIVGLETAFPVLYTYLVKKGIITLERLIELMAINPRRRFGLQSTDDICVYDLQSEYKIDPCEFKSKGKSTPFDGMTVSGKNLLTICGGKAVWNITEN